MSNQTIKKSFIWDLAGSFIRQFAGVFVSIILARLLSPEEFGIVGMAIVFVSITEVFIDVGFTSGLIQKKNVSDIVYSSIFYLNFLISVVLSLLIIFIAPFVGDFYSEPKVSEVLFYLALIPPIAALGKVQSSILSKRMDFKSLSIRNIFATLIGGAVGVTAALLDFGVYSLVLQQIFSVLTSTLLLWYATRWRPKWEFSFTEVKSLLGYSSYVFFDQALRQIFNKIDTIYIGKVFSPAILGFYSRAESLKAQINTYSTNSLRKVMFPALSALQDDEKGFADAYFKAFNVVTGVTVLLVAPIYFLSEEIIIGLLGNKWQPSIIFFQILLFATLTSPHIGMMAQAVLAKGLSKLKFQIGLIQRFLKFMPIVIGLLFNDIILFTITVVCATTLVFFIYAYVVHKKLKLNFVQQMKDFFLPNLLFFLAIFIFNFFENLINNLYFTLIFFIINFYFFRIIKQDSLQTIKNLIFLIRSKKLKKK
uniref:lipopolysaccharide biosynthesis protein n=2 Tax=Flavobacterium sp. TaxID=239 RepID=UPI004048FEE4